MPHSNESNEASKQIELSRAFDPHVWTKAVEAAAHCRISIEATASGEFIGACDAFPHAFAEGTSVESCYRATQEVIAVTVAENEAHASPSDGADSGASAESVFDAFDRYGLIGCVEGPGDKSTNPKYFEGFGRD